MEWIPNQPICFSEDNTCSSDEFNFTQLVDNTDKTQFQLKCDPCISAQQLILSPQFDTSDGWDLSGLGWVISDGLLCGSTISGYIPCTTSFDSGYYKFIFEVYSIDQGATLEIQFDTHLIGSITETGTYEFYAFSGALDRTLKLYVTGLSGSVCLSMVESYQILTNLIVPIYNNLDVYQTEISYSNNPNYFTFVDNSVTVTIDWAALSLSNDCYYLCLLDPCVNHNGQNYPANIRDGGFDSSLVDNWSVGGGVSQVGSTVEFSGLSLISQISVFNSFTSTISISVTVSAISGSLLIKYGDNLIQTITTVGIHEISGIPSGDFTLTLTMTTGTCTIDGVEPILVQTSEYVCDASSKLMKLADYSNSCTLLINGCNNNNAFGFIFENSDFSPRIRIEAKLKNSKYLNERSIFEDSMGKKGVYYASLRKQKTLAIDLQPEYVHDFLALSLGFDNFFIDGKNYFVEDDEYNIQYVQTLDNVGSVLINVSEKVQNIKNKICTSNENICTLPPNFLLQGNRQSYIVQADGFKFIING
jgi:hypothetical protein